MWSLSLFYYQPIAKANNVTITNLNDLIGFLKTVDKNLLASAHFDNIAEENGFWLPCIERKFIQNVALIRRVIYKLSNIILLSAENTVDAIFLRSPDVIMADNFQTDLETMFGFASHVKHLENF